MPRPTGPLVAIAADATVVDADLQPNTDHWIRFHSDSEIAALERQREAAEAAASVSHRGWPTGGRTTSTRSGATRSHG